MVDNARAVLGYLDGVAREVDGAVVWKIAQRLQRPRSVNGGGVRLVRAWSARLGRGTFSSAEMLGVQARKGGPTAYHQPPGPGTLAGIPSRTAIGISQGA